MMTRTTSHGCKPPPKAIFSPLNTTTMTASIPNI